MPFYALAAAIGAALAYFFDPESGKRRRHGVRDRSLALFHSSGRKAARTGRAISAETYGIKQKVRHWHEEEKPQPDDVTLAHKVETIIFRDADAPKGQVDVNAVDGVVYLRGEVQRPEIIDELVSKARSVQGVRGVESLLHLPGTPAPMT